MTARARWLAAASELALAGSDLLLGKDLTDEAVLAVVSAVARTRAANHLAVAQVYREAEAAAKEAERS